MQDTISNRRRFEYRLPPDWFNDESEQTEMAQGELNHAVARFLHKTRKQHTKAQPWPEVGAGGALMRQTDNITLFKMLFTVMNDGNHGDWLLRWDDIYDRIQNGNPGDFYCCLLIRLAFTDALNDFMRDVE